MIRLNGGNFVPRCESLAACGLLFVLACERTSIENTNPLPPLSSLSPVMTITSGDSSRIAGAIGVADCEIVVSSRAGEVFLIDGTGRFTLVDSLPQSRGLTFERGRRDGPVIAWSQWPVSLVLLNHRPYRRDPLPIPQSPWGKWVGPITAFGDRLAMAPFGNADRLLRVPLNANGTPLIVVFDSMGVVQHLIGPSIAADTGYIPWLKARATLGSTGDTLLLVSYETGVVTRIHSGAARPDTAWQLRKYFKPVKIRQKILRLPWIQSGDFPYFWDTPAVLNATFGPDGRLYAIRPYGFRWHATPNAYVRNAGEWTPTSFALEVYSVEGKFMGGFALPSLPRGIRVDDFGRLFTVGDFEVRVFQDPMAPPTTCHGRDISLPDARSGL